ncbi:TMV resistance protein N [Glycine soja]|uniref:TMV resistance protein N n=1 Tax=Glycine soja TaxID=3848 RepID=A0A0B2PTQ1_GLYSO|nr:TMV resistance protein N [Glycine soja]
MAVRSFSYDVFLSFRGEDTRYSFTGNLYNVLRERGIHTFIDDDELQKGDQITSALEEAIEKSKIFIIVLSENYAYSSFCLNELTHILNNFTKGKNDLLVLPVFYIVDPSDVRHHRGSFGEALANHEKKLNSDNMEKLETWKMALHQVSNISGHHFQHDGFVNLTILNLDKCDSLTEIPDVSCLSKLEKLSFARCRNLFTIHYSVGLLEKLKILYAGGCPELKSFPPLKLTSLEQFELSGCHNLESFPGILGKMENITVLDLDECRIKEFRPSFRNLTRLQELYLGQETYRLRGFDAATFISNICMMPELARVEATQLQWRLLPDDVLKLSSVVCSSMQHLEFIGCDLSDELLWLFLSCFVNVKNLNLSASKFTVIPECIKDCRFLTTLTLDYCDRLQEIRGIPPNLKYFSALGCLALTSSSISMLQNQELHEVGDTFFILPSGKIPGWFEP